jgi:hypothetical protein
MVLDAVTAANGQPIALDLFSGAGGYARGLQRAGFYVIGVDIVPQPHYGGDVFIHGDAFEALAAIRGMPPGQVQYVHASPPCPHYSVLNRSWNVDKAKHPDWIGRVRDELSTLRLPWSIENVVGARKVMRHPAKLCGSMFDLPIERHRLFETSFLLAAPQCNHKRQRQLWPEGFPALRSDRVHGQRARVVGIYGAGGGPTKDLALWRWAMDVPWMETKREVSDALPPAYGHWVGHHVMLALGHSSTLDRTALLGVGSRP